MDDLGTPLSTHIVRNRRRWIAAAQGAVVGFAAAALLVVMVASPVWSKAAGKLVGLLLVAIVAGFLVAVVQAVKAARGGPREEFQLYEHGIAHATRTGRRVWRWERVKHIHRSERARWFPRNGWDFRCAVAFDDGSAIRFNGLTADAPSVAGVLLIHRPDALTGQGEIRGWRLLRWVLPLVAAGCAWAVVTIFRALNDDEITVEVSPGYLTTEPRFTDSQIALLAIAMLVCFVGFAVSLSYLGVGLAARRRRR
jgi:hypothetical protein